MDNGDDIITVVNIRGRVVRARRWEISLLKEQGMRVILNPKQEYYPEWDIENPRSVPLTDKVLEINAGEVLEVESV